MSWHCPTTSINSQAMFTYKNRVQPKNKYGFMWIRTNGKTDKTIHTKTANCNYTAIINNFFTTTCFKLKLHWSEVSMLVKHNGMMVDKIANNFSRWNNFASHNSLISFYSAYRPGRNHEQHHRKYAGSPWYVSEIIIQNADIPFVGAKCSSHQSFLRYWVWYINIVQWLYNLKKKQEPIIPHIHCKFLQPNNQVTTDIQLA